jgi:hypothetical protein
MVLILVMNAYEYRYEYGYGYGILLLQTFVTFVELDLWNNNLVINNTIIIIISVADWCRESGSDGSCDPFLRRTIGAFLPCSSSESINRFHIQTIGLMSL